ncbi:MAG TPA: hypothetical protein ENJ80_12080 [Gammaproteobacteria bacterium]|nr:hypothetical protein [Gammaproteobacteria bacterium]
MKLARFVVVLFCLSGPLTAQAASIFHDEDDDERPYRGSPKEEWHELDADIPPWPEKENLIPLKLDLGSFPYSLFIDGNSLSVGEDKVVRYTVVLRSPNGVENVTYEGIRCKNKQVRRYAYGSRGQFRPVRKPQWRFIRNHGHDLYRRELVRVFFCPLPVGDSTAQILEKLKKHDFVRFQYQEDQM